MGNIFSSDTQKEPTNPQPPQYNLNRSTKGQTRTPLVICYSYIGTGYHGLQQNLEQKTIEKDLLRILINSGLIEPDMVRSLNRIKWKEGSKTDRGVHSAAQILTFEANFPTGLKLKDVLPLLRSNTPKDVPIYFWSVISVGSKFNAHTYAQHRQYNYLLPFSAIGNADLNYLRNEILPLFIGEHNFHNYTKKMSYDNPSCVRTITDFTVSDPFSILDIKFVLFYIRGNSFVINQIRKMIATVLSATHNLITVDQIQDTFTRSNWQLPRLPGDGLFLNKIEYTNFKNNSMKRKDFNEGNKNVEFDDVRLSIEKWKKNVLFPHIAGIVRKDNVFDKWINDVLLKFPPVKSNE